MVALGTLKGRTAQGETEEGEARCVGSRVGARTCCAWEEGPSSRPRARGEEDVGRCGRSGSTRVGGVGHRRKRRACLGSGGGCCRQRGRRPYSKEVGEEEHGPGMRRRTRRKKGCLLFRQ